MNLNKYILILALTNTVGTLSMRFDSLSAPKIDNYAFSLIHPYNKVVTKNAPPSIGVYSPEYPMIPTLTRIQLAPEMINKIPDQLKKALTGHIPNIIFNVLMSRAEYQTYNLVFHAWARTWQAQKLFDINIPMGIFAANGVQPSYGASISFDQLSDQNVHVHPADNDVLAYSPNNATFTISPHREMSTFWSIGISPNRQQALVTYHILANTNKSENLINETLISAHTVGEFLQALHVSAQMLEQPMDRKAVEEAVSTIENIIGVQAVVARAEAQNVNLDEMRDSLPQLTRTLIQLENQLKNESVNQRNFHHPVTQSKD